MGKHAKKKVKEHRLRHRKEVRAHQMHQLDSKLQAQRQKNQQQQQQEEKIEDLFESESGSDSGSEDEAIPTVMEIEKLVEEDSDEESQESDESNSDDMAWIESDGDDDETGERDSDDDTADDSDDLSALRDYANHVLDIETRSSGPLPVIFSDVFDENLKSSTRKPPVSQRKKEKRQKKHEIRTMAKNLDENGALSREQAAFTRAMDNLYDQTLSEVVAEPVSSSFKSRLARVQKKQTAREKVRKHEKESGIVRKHTKKGKGHDTGFTLGEIVGLNRTIREFITAEFMSSLPFPPMSRLRRRQVHELGKQYNLSVAGAGSGVRRYCKLSRTESTLIPGTEEEFLPFLKSLIVMKDTGSEPDTPTSRQLKESVQPRAGSIIGATASPLGEENKGMRMLMAMGWSGGGLGSTGQGIEEPLRVQVRERNSGLGFKS